LSCFRDNFGIKTAREGLQHNPGKTRQKSIGHARSGILFMDHERTARQPGGNTTWSAGESTHTQYSCRTTTNNYAERLQQCPDEL
jgi:hypothetical protein